jgi:SAM-dependent methyltransferase
VKKLDFGCGQTKKPDYVGMDVVPGPGVDVLHDFNVFPYPFADSEFDEILCRSSLEHVDQFLRTMVELHRILRPDGLLEIAAPHYSGADAYRDPTHKTFFAYTTFDLFTTGGSYRSRYNGLFRVEMRCFGIPDRHVGPKAIAKYLMNKIPDIYENYLCWMLPAKTISYRLRAIK